MAHSIVFLALTALVVAPLNAQTYYGSLRGLITDATGGSIAGAQVSLIDEATNIKRATVSTGAGEYVFSSLDPGTYTLVVESPSFKRYQQKGITVGTQQTVAIDVPLSIGSAAESVEVNASGPVIDTATASNGQLFDSQKLTELPNLGRNPFLFSKLSNNVTPTGDPRFNRFQDQSGSSQISVSGAPLSTNNYEIDGVPISDFSNRAVIIPSLDAVQEVKIQANNYDAEAGRSGGGVFNTLLKSGTNTLHGNLYGSTRQTDWAANTWINDHYGNPKQPNTQYSYEGSLGGPIWIPKLYNGRDRTFFWVTEEGYRQRSPLSTNWTLPTAAEKTGDFSDMIASGTDCNTTPVSGCIYNPYNVVNGVRQAFSGNKIPSQYISTVGQNIMNYYPAGSSPTSSFTGNDLLGDRADEFIAKIDHKITSWWLANASYMHYGSKEPGGNPLGTATGVTTSSYNSYLLYRKVDAFQVNSTVTLNPTTVIIGGFGFNRFPNNTTDLSSGFNQASLGFPSSYASAMKNAFPAIVMTSAGSSHPSIGTNESGPAVYYSRNFVIGVNKTLGRHTLKAGYVFRTISLDFTSISYTNGYFKFNNTATSQHYSNDSTTGVDYASLLLGLPVSSASDSYVQTTTPLALNVHYNAGYVQDDIRVNPKLNLNIGLRYEWEPGIRERSNHYTVGFDRTVTNPISSDGVTTLGGLMYAGQNGYSSNCCDNSKTKWSPRLGLAYSINPKLVFRAGYGVYYIPIGYTNSGSYASGYTQSNYINSFDSAGNPGNTLDNPFPSGLSQPSGNSNGYKQNLFSSITTYDQYRRSPVMQQYSADIQQELPWGISLQLGYVGAKGRNLLPASTGGTININQLPDQYLSMSATALNTAVANPYYGHGGTGTYAKSTIAQYYLLRPFPAFTTINLSASPSQSLYNSLIIKVQKRFTNGLSLLTAYTWASNWDSIFSQSDSLNTGNSGPQDAYNIKGEYARSINDMPNRFSLASTYELPFGHNKKFLNSSRWLDLAVGGWSVNWVSVVQNGSPLAITQATNNNSAYGMSVQRPNFASGVKACGSGSPQSRLNNYLNVSAFTTAGAATYGNVSRTISCYGPGLANTDLSIFKDFKVKEKINFQFRAEAMNAFNTPQFGTPQTSWSATSSTFGSILNNGASPVINFPRYIALGGRIEF